MTCKHEHDGITVGSGMVTGVPVDLHASHGNVLILGETGSGKTAAMKLVAKRATYTYRAYAAYIIDHMDEYEDVAKKCDISRVHIYDSVPNVGSYSVFTLKGQHSDSDKSEELMAEALAKAWKRVKELPNDEIKLIILDEAQKMLRTPVGSETINEILSDEKNRNVLFVAAMQTVRGVKADLYGKFGTRIFMRLSDTVPEEAVSCLDCPDRKQLSKIQRGCGLLVTADHRVYMRFE